MLKTVDYQNWSTKIFDGFYESHLYNSDSEYYYNEYMNDGEENRKEYELKDFQGFCNDVAKKASELLHEQVVFDDSIIQSIDFDSIDSPRYYNYGTDRLNLKVKLNQRALELYCFREKDYEFGKYLSDYFTDRDGFWSFIKNNIPEFKQQYVEEGKSGRCLNVMIEFYLLQNVDFDSYKQDLYEYANESLFEYMEEV